MKQLSIVFDISDEATEQFQQFLVDSGRVIECITLVGNGTMDFVPRNLRLHIEAPDSLDSPAKGH